MKHLTSLLLITLTTFACTKDAVTPAQDPDDGGPSTFPTSIRAGQEDGIGINSTDLSPNLDLLVTPWILQDSLYMDLNEDLTNDFKLTYRISNPFMLGSEFARLELVPLDSSLVCVDPNNPTLADSLLFDDPINATRTWSDTVAVLFHYTHSQSGNTTESGYFRYNHAHYIGVMLTVDGKTLYGWIYLDNLSLDKYGITTGY